QIDFGSDYSQQVDAMLDGDRRQATKLLDKAIKAAEEAFAAIHDLRQFTSPATLATLNSWGRLAEAPIKIHVAFDGACLRVGKVESQWRRIDVEPAYLFVLPKLPRLRQKSAAA